jgi:pyruvate/2-oxoglutarate dehydrogenase complex dihydrolipoamide dehydrogenase (E3) component
MSTEATARLAVRPADTVAARLQFRSSGKEATVAEIREFDVIVLGAGPAGEVCAGRLADNGRSVALVERELVGGECSFYACMPSKALLRPGQALAEARRVPGAAQAATGELDVAAALHRRDEIIHELDDSAQLPWIEERSITLVRGQGELTGERELRVGEELLRAREAIVLAPGTGASIPPIPGLREADPWTNREVTTASEIPSSLLILGGGVVGVEMAQAYASLGAKVTLVEALPRLIAAEEEFAAEQVREALEEAGVEVVLGVKATAVSRQHPDGTRGPVTLGLEDGRSFTGEELLVAVGRRAHTDSLGLEQFGLEAGKPVEVDEKMRVPGHDWLYVIGDANGRVLLTHMGKYQARLAADQILGRPTSLRSDAHLSPRVIFTEPQVAAVGHTLASARKAGLDVREVDVGTGANAGGSYIGKGAPGTARIVVDEQRKVIVGATFTGVEVAEALHAATIAVIAEVPLEQLWHAVPCFPTRSELWLRLLEKYGL